MTHDHHPNRYMSLGVGAFEFRARHLEHISRDGTKTDNSLVILGFER